MKIPLSRKDFIRKAAVLSAALALSPHFSWARKDTTPAFSMDDNAIIDLHCHPSLKIYMLNKTFWLRHLLRSPGANMVHMQEDMHEFSFGFVRGILATHYLPEAGIEKQWGTLKFLWPAIRKLAFRTADKIEHGDYSNFTQVNQMMDDLESQIHTANEKLKEEGSPLRFLIAPTPEKFLGALSRPGHITHTIPVAHAIEGAHALGSNFMHSGKKLEKRLRENLPPLAGEGKMTLPDYIRNLEALHLRGVCLITLSHFFANDISYPVEGISPEQKKTPDMTWVYDPAKHNLPLTVPVGEAVVAHMLEIGVIVDLTHSTPAVRDGVYRLNNDRAKAGKPKRPVVFTHTGAKKLFDDHNGPDNINYDSYGVRPEDIKAIYDCDGVIGVIPEIFWLAGANVNPEIDGQTPADPKLGIPYMIETLKYINSQMPVADFRHVAIGTDFDGLAENPKDLYLNEQLGGSSGLFAQLLADPAIGARSTALITYQNSLRVLQAGWLTPITL